MAPKPSSASSGSSGSGPTIASGASRKAPVLVDKRYAITAKNESHELHGRKRIGITFIYLLILQQIANRAMFDKSTQVELTPASLQAKKGNGRTQAAHQVFGEIKINSVELYLLSDLKPDEKQSIVYCTAAVSNIDRSYNLADANVEVYMRPIFLKIADNIVKRIDTVSPGQLWDILIQIIIDAYEPALARLRSNFKKSKIQGEETTLEDIEKVLFSYKENAILLLGRRAAIERHSVEHWMTKLIKRGFKKKI